MNIIQGIQPVSQLKKNTAQLLKYVNQSKNNLIITQNGKAKVVIMDAEKFQQIEDQIALTQLIALGVKDLKKGKTYTHEEVLNDLKKHIKIKKEKK